MHHNACLITVLAMAGSMASAVVTQSTGTEAAPVVIVGGADQTGHHYTWQVTNRSASRLVRIEFPQYGADTFITPEDWIQGTQKEMNLVNVGWDYNNPGVCWAEPKPDYAGLEPGATATFGMRIARDGALRSSGAVTVKFADGSQAHVAGVELPAMPVKTSPWAAFLGLGLIFVVFIVYREWRRSQQPAAVEQDGDDKD